MELTLGKKGGETNKAADYPTKTTINLVAEQKESASASHSLVMTVVMLVLVALFAKFAVWDPISSAVASSAEVAAAEERLASLKESNAEFESLRDEYGKYIVQGLTDEEAAQVTRSEVLDLFEGEISKVGYMESVSLTGNTLTVSTVGASMEEVSALVARLEANEDVQHVTVSTARSDDGNATSATFTVLFKSVTADAEATTTTTSATTDTKKEAN